VIDVVQVSFSFVPWQLCLICVCCFCLYSAATKLSESFYTQRELEMMASHVLDVDWVGEEGQMNSFPVLGGKVTSVRLRMMAACARVTWSTCGLSSGSVLDAVSHRCCVYTWLSCDQEAAKVCCALIQRHQAVSPRPTGPGWRSRASAMVTPTPHYRRLRTLKSFLVLGVALPLLLPLL
jgi:hypothetical protein